jgi:SET domain-containing protein
MAMWRARLNRLLPALAVAAAVSLAYGQTSFEKDLEIRPSRIPHAGNGVFTTLPLPKGAILGAYTGEFVSEEEYQRRAAEDHWQYMMGLLDCATSHTNGIRLIDGINGNVFTRMNYAPAEFQNVKFEKICEPPFVRIVALRNIAAGEELWVDYGPNYRYDFMQDPAVVQFFADLGARRGQERPYQAELEIRPSAIPHAGNGVYTKASIPKGTYLGAYVGEFITDEEFERRAAANRWQYMMGLLDCAKPHTGGITTIDGIEGNVFTRMNYAPPEFQNVTFEKVCDAPFVRVLTVRDLAAGEELWVDYGPNYPKDFMNDPAVSQFFAGLRARRDKSGRGAPPAWWPEGVR